MNANLHEQASIAACRSVAPEDLQCGDYVSILNEVTECPSFLWSCDTFGLAPDEPVRIPFKPQDSGIPYRIKAICLPFVFAVGPHHSLRTFDVRTCQLTRLTNDYGRTVTKAMEKQPGMQATRRAR